MTDSRDELLEEEAPLTAEDEARAQRTTRIVGLLAVIILVGVGLLLWKVYGKKDQSEVEQVFENRAPEAASGDQAEIPRVIFREEAAARGLVFRHHNGATGEKLLPETMGAGAVFFDFDGDADPDLFCVNSAPWDDVENAPTGKLFRNDEGRFVDVTAGSGLDVSLYGMGASAGDLDGDGRDDLFVTAVGRNRLFRNLGEGRFEDISARAGIPVDDERWSTGSALLDADRDGDLDLIVANYVVWSAAIDQEQGFQLTGLGRAYGPPKSFRGEIVQYFRNEGGRFEDATEAAGFRVLNRATGVPVAKSLGVCICDWNLDGWPDVVIANDTVRNFAFENRQDGSFEEKGGEIGVAFDSGGNARGAMGIDSAFWANDGRLAVAVGNFAQETTAFYVNEDPEFPIFNDIAAGVGIGAATRDSLTFGVRFADYDLDGRQDLIAVNGHVEPEINAVLESQDHAQPLELFWNTGPKGKWKLAPVPVDRVGDELYRPFVGRGLATADIDGDGDLDLLATENGGAVRLFVNQLDGGRSLRLDLRDAQGRRVHGVRVEVESEAGKQTRFAGMGHSYLSQSELTLTFGLARAEKSGPIQVYGAGGKTWSFEGMPAGRHTLTLK